MKQLASLAWLVSFAALGCKPPTPDEQMDSVRSWLATADLSAQAWVNHITPEKYTRQTLELSRKNVDQAADALLKSPPAGVDSAALDSLLTGSSRRLDRIVKLVVSRNAPNLRTELDSLRAEEKSVEEIADRLKAKQ